MADMGDYDVIVGADSFRSTANDAVQFPHRWTTDGVTVNASFTGAHLLHLAAAGCVLNDVYREAENLGIAVLGVRVSASGAFNPETWQSTGISYAVEVDTAATAAEVDELLQRVDSVAEIPKAIRARASAHALRADAA